MTTTINNDLFTFPTFDLSERVSASELCEALMPLFQPGIADGSVYWADSLGHRAKQHRVIPRGDRVLSISLAPGGNEGYQLTVNACLEFDAADGGLAELRWLPVLQAKVWSKQAGAQLAAQILVATADAFVW